MGTSDWINLIAAILIGGGTLALALMTWRSIRQTNNIQKKERRERLLNEIIDWSEAVGNATNVENIPHTAEVDDVILKDTLWSNIQNKLFNLETKAEYIETLAKENFGETLRQAIEDLTMKLCEVIYLTAKGPLQMENPEDSFDMTGAFGARINELKKRMENGDEELWDDAADELNDLATELLMMTAEIKSELAR